MIENMSLNKGLQTRLMPRQTQDAEDITSTAQVQIPAPQWDIQKATSYSSKIHTLRAKIHVGLSVIYFPNTTELLDMFCAYSKTLCHPRLQRPLSAYWDRCHRERSDQRTNSGGTFFPHISPLI